MTLATLSVGHRSGGLCLFNTRSILRDIVQEAGDKAGIGKLVPKQPAASTTLRNSMLELGVATYGKRRKQPIVVRQLVDSKGFECVRVLTGADRNQYLFLFSAHIDNNWNVNVLDLNDGPSTADGLPVTALWVESTLQEVVYRLRDYLPGPVVSQVVVRGLKQWGAMPLKEDGGAWFLNSVYLPQYRAFADHVRDNGGKGDGPRFSVTEFSIDANPDTVSHVVEQVRTTVKEGVEAIMSEVLDAAGGMTDRSIEVRIAKCNKMLALVQQYVDAFGVSMPDLTDAIEQCRQAVAVNRLLSSAV